MLQKIAIKHCSGLVLPNISLGADTAVGLSFAAEMMQFGYMPDIKLSTQLAQLSVADLTSLYVRVIPVLKKAVGANVVHKPFYPGFPEQVMQMSELELFSNAIAHYHSHGQWLPNFSVNSRPVSFEDIKFKPLTVVSNSDVDNVFTNLLSSADSISASNKDIIRWFVTSNRSLNVPAIPFKENMCVLAATLFDHDKWDESLVTTTTDILRIATYLNDGDISLSESTRFKSLPRRQRKVLVRALEKVIKEEDLMLHKQKWVRLFHNLHVGDYSDSLYSCAKKLRENIKIETFNGNLEQAYNLKDYKTVISLLTTRPGVFARNISRLIGATGKHRPDTIAAFKSVVDDVPTRNLTQLWGSLKTRSVDVDKRVIFPKGAVSSAYVLRNKLARLPKKYLTALIDIIKQSLHTRFTQLEPLGTVWIDPDLTGCPLPTGMRSASEGLKEVARGTRMEMCDKDTLRFFVYWKGQDIDLSASIHDENFNQVEVLSYYDLRGTFGCHSGDITSAPDGASEFIEIDIAQALKKGRYIAMHVMVYSGPTFKEHEECFAGWMSRDAVNSNEIYEPKTVTQKIDLCSDSKNVIPVMFDLLERKAIWVDINTNGKSFNTVAVNNVENNKATIADTVEAFVSLDNKISLHELFTLHAEARGELVSNVDDADTVFTSFESSFGLSPYDITEINAGYL